MQDNGQFYVGVVESRNDPLRLGRCKVRVIGLHTYEKDVLPTEDLPWALPMQPVTSAGMSGIGDAPIGPVEGTNVVVVFADYPDCQQPIMFGVLGGIPQGNPVLIDKLDSVPVIKDSITPGGRKIPTNLVEATALQACPTGTATNPIITALGKQGTGNLDMNSVLGGALPASVATALDLNKINPNMSSNENGGWGNMANVPMQLGSSFGGINNTYEAALLSTGSVQAAASVLVSAIASAGGTANLLTSIVGTLASTGSLAQLLGSSPVAALGIRTPVTSLGGTPTVSAGAATGAKIGSTPVSSGAGGKISSAPTTTQPSVSKDSSASLSKTGTPSGPVMSPPNGFKGDKIAATNNIKALISACDKHGLSSKEQKCTLLGIVGGECNWIPQAENYQYSSPSRLLQVFPSSFKGNQALAEKWSNWKNKGSREEFFDFVYDPSRNGRQLGNSKPGDGGKFFGRGFIQLTGRANYEKYAKLSGHDIVNNPNLLVSNVGVSADIAVLYLKDRVNKSVAATAHPGYFYAAKRCVGNNTNDIAARKLKYYEHFYSCQVPESFGYADKTAGNTVAPKSYDGVAQTTKTSPTHGFCDPNNKYPLNRHTNEQDSHRLARGVTDRTIVPLKESKRTLGIPMPMHMGSFDQPAIPYGAVYPHNKSRETESGHVVEFDDTPHNERIHEYHRSGTFREIDASGTLVTKIVGDGYTIYDRNGFIFIAGDCNVTAAGNVNIYCQSDANIQVEGSAELQVGCNLDVSVARDMTVAVGGDYNVWAEGKITFQTAGEMHQYAKGKLYVTSDTQVDIKSTGDINQDGNKVYLNSGKAGSATIEQMEYPEPGSPLYPQIDYLESSGAHGEERYMYESEDDGKSPASRAYMNYDRANNGTKNTYASESSKATGGTSKASETSGGNQSAYVNKIVTKDQIMNTQNFTADFRLSEHFTLGMLFDGGFNKKHHLVNQNGLTKQQIVYNLSLVCNNILEKYLTVLPDGISGMGKLWRITSGYRMGTSRSDHSKGRAVDIALLPAGSSQRRDKHFALIKEMEKMVPYDQIILEYRQAQNWIHTGFRGVGDIKSAGPAPTNRKMAFTMNNDKTYGQGFHLLA